MGRILAVDYGQRRLGLALSDETQTIAQGLKTLEGMNPAQMIEAISAIVRQQAVEEIIIGHPISQSGRPTRRSREVEEFRQALSRQVTVPVKLVDERFTTALAQRYLSEIHRRVSAAQHPMDKVAATILLQDYLEWRRNRAAGERTPS